MKKFFLLFLLLIFFVPKTNAQEIDNGYAIKSYDVDIVVNENNTYSVKEKINFLFLTTTHYIDRYIPFLSEDHIDIIGDVQVPGYDYEVNKKNGDCIISVGNDNTIMNSNTTITFYYTIDAQKDSKKNGDIFTFNVIPTGWDTSISNVDFRITMPKSFSKEDIVTYVGSAGSEHTEDFVTIDGNVISGSYDYLAPYKGITLTLNLPEGYFNGVNRDYSIVANIVFALAIMLTALMFILWLIYGKDGVIIVVPEFLPPNKMSSAEVGYLNRRSKFMDCITGNIIDLANLGCLTIEDKGKEDFVLHKIADYQGTNPLYISFMNRVFATSNDISKNALGKILGESGVLFELFKGLSRKRKEQYAKKSRSLTLLGNILLGIPLTVCVIIFGIIYGSINSIIVMLIYLSITAICLLCRFFAHPFVAVVDIFIVGYICFSIGVIYKDYMNFYPELMMMFVVCCTCYIPTFILVLLMPQLTKEGLSLMGKIKGFRNFIEYAKVEELETLAAHNPTYYFDILGYAYALGLSDVWCEKFKNILIGNIAWYSGSTAFNVTSMHVLCNSISHTTIPSSSRGGGGGFSGGRSSGGGHGGGGGGRR